MYLMWNIQILILFQVCVCVYIYFYWPIICNSNQCSFLHIYKYKYLILPADIGFAAWNLIFSQQVRMSAIFKLIFSIILLFLLLTFILLIYSPFTLNSNWFSCMYCRSCNVIKISLIYLFLLWKLKYFIYKYIYTYISLTCCVTHIPVKAIKLHLLSEQQKSEYFFGIATRTHSILKRTFLFQ